ncbi:MAG: ABC transporter permease [Candidatus Altiarchaeota archaeon]
MIADYVKFAIDSIKHRKLRTWLTMLGIFIGIFAVVALISLGQGLQAYIDDQFRQVGGNRIIISPGSNFGAATAMFGASELFTSKLTKKDLDAVKKVKGVENAIGILAGRADVEFKEKRVMPLVFSVPTDAEDIKFVKEINFFDIEKGRFLQSSDLYKVVVGYETGKHYFNKELKIGEKIKIQDKEFEIIGITKKTGNPLHERRIIIPIDIARELFNKSEEFSSINVKVEDGFIPKEVADDIKKELRKERNVKKGEEDFLVETAESIVSSFKNVLAIVQILLVGIATISLIVGGVGIMNTMYTSVLERTKQIGIMKSVGARNSDIMLIFLIESGILGMIGGAIGCMIGMIFSYSVEHILKANNIEFVKIYFSFELIFGALLFSFMVGCISGLMPARKAAMMNPVDALRYKL